ncbi:MAG: DUF255 domain-containing protein [Cytophagales bacterium]|nr:MAG: DUF255 domain-containing protein [Cytophagales bacterium]TAF62095.1 MAG: DUF255 domain-containing protein [Cytophagales bacterium]
MRQFRRLFFCLLWFFPSALWAQNAPLQTTTWESKVSTTKAKVGDEIELVFLASIIDDWYLYSTDFDPNLGPTITTFEFQKDPSYKLVGKIKPIKPKKKFDDTWGGEYTYFIKKAEFRQKIKILSPNLKVKTNVVYQTCTDIDGKCIQYEEDFYFDKKSLSIEGDVMASTSDTAQAMPDTAADTSASEVQPTEPQKVEPINQNFGEEETKSSSLWGLGLVAFLSGLAALLTPCVFPMIPMTVSFFTSRSSSRLTAILQALTYGFSIILIYTLIGVVVSRFAGPEFANELATNPIPNAIFFIIFLVFAISFFGAFDITLPSNFVNAVDKQSDRGGYLGAFFMAFTLVLVSFSCTGPIASTVLIESANGEFWRPVVAMLGFSLAFALPFTLFAIFPSMLQSLPKSGGWLNTVKVVLGFVELALAFKFLSMIDRVLHWELLNRDIYLAIWIAIFFCMGIYLFGFIRLPHDSKTETLSVGRLLMAISAWVAVVYMVPGLFGAPLNMLSGYLPPMSSQEFTLSASGSTTDSGKSNTISNVKYGDLFEMPHGLTGYYEYNEALKAAKAANKPLLIDFTGHGCVNCQKMEETVWSVPQVLNILKNDYIIVSLYVDARNELPEKEWVTGKDGKIKNTIGRVNAALQLEKFNQNAQPYYVLLDPRNEGLLVTPPIGSQFNPSIYAAYLKAGVDAYKSR